MTGTVQRFGFDDSRITRHLTLLAIMDTRGFDAARREMGEYLLGEVQDNLDGQKLANGNPMPQSKAAIKRSGKTLIDKHHLYDSYVYQLSGGGVEIGSALVYAAVHHFGGETGRAGHRFTLPARPVLGIGQKQEVALGSFLLAEIAKVQA